MFLRLRHFNWISNLKTIIVVIVTFFLSLAIEDWLANNYGIDFSKEDSPAYYFTWLKLPLLMFIISSLLDIIVFTIRGLLQSIRNSW